GRMVLCLLVGLVAERGVDEVVGAAHVDDAAVDDLQCTMLEGGSVHTTGGQKVAGGLEQPKFDVLYVTQKSALVELDLAPVLGLLLANTDPAADPDVAAGDESEVTSAKDQSPVHKAEEGLGQVERVVDDTSHRTDLPRKTGQIAPRGTEDGPLSVLTVLIDLAEVVRGAGQRARCEHQAQRSATYPDLEQHRGHQLSARAGDAHLQKVVVRGVLLVDEPAQRGRIH